MRMSQLKSEGTLAGGLQPCISLAAEYPNLCFGGCFVGWVGMARLLSYVIQSSSCGRIEYSSSH